MYAIRIRGRRPVPLSAEAPEARRLFQWYLSECAVQQLHRYRLVDALGQQVARGDAVGAVPFYQQDPEAGL